MYVSGGGSSISSSCRLNRCLFTRQLCKRCCVLYCHSLLLRLLAFQHQLPEVKGAKKEVVYAFTNSLPVCEALRVCGLRGVVSIHELALMLLVCEAWSVR